MITSSSTRIGTIAAMRKILMSMKFDQCMYWELEWSSMAVGSDYV